ncbi:hypothetical protein [Gemmata sp.]|uniref:hypothetical protein n=1 Tax=Gemmata sp. TaxID=1914242 RepID=UPI003F6F429B
MQISAYLADWERLRHHLRTHGTNLWESDSTWFRADSFTVWNDSYSLNQEIGELFLEIHERLPEGAGERLGKFLVTFCPRLAHAENLEPPQDLEISPAWFYSAASPQEVRQRLALIDELDLPHVFALFYDQFLGGQPDLREFALAREREVVEVFFMWAAAMGQAVSKGWGLVVALD